MLQMRPGTHLIERACDGEHANGGVRRVDERNEGLRDSRACSSAKYRVLFSNASVGVSARARARAIEVLGEID
jgi:hypothetical protein